LYGDDRIIITPEERRAVKANEKDFYILIVSEDISLFTFKVYPLMD